MLGLEGSVKEGKNDSILIRNIYSLCMLDGILSKKKTMNSTKSIIQLLNDLFIEAPQLDDSLLESGNVGSSILEVVYASIEKLNLRYCVKSSQIQMLGTDNKWYDFNNEAIEWLYLYYSFLVNKIYPDKFWYPSPAFKNIFYLVVGFIAKKNTCSEE